MTTGGRDRVVALATQGMLLGLTSAFLIVPVSAIFLEHYGSARLPYTYLVVAVLGAVVSLRLASAIRRRSLIRLAVLTIGSTVVAYLASWVLLRTVDAVWTSFALWVVFPLQLQLGFVFIGAQAGRLLDVRQIKRFFPRVVSGFSAGFLIGGAVTLPLASAMATEDMLLLTTGAGAALVAAFFVTGRRYHSLLDVPDTVPPTRGPRVRAGSILRNRYVATIFAFQVLSAAGSQTADFLAFDRAAARYATSEGLAGFAATLATTVNVSDLLFLAVVAGWIITRFGQRVALLANPAVDATFTLGLLVAGVTRGVDSTAFFVLAAATRVADWVFTDGMTRTAINTSYQAVSPDRRFAAQAAVEGIGVPVALGVVGVALIAFDAIGAGPMVTAAALGVVCLAWLVLGVAAFRGYRRNLAVRIRRREIAAVDLEHGDPETIRVAEAAIASPDIARVRIGLDVLRDAGSPRLQGLLESMLGDPRTDWVVEALGRLEGSLSPEAAARAALLLGHEAGAVRAAAAGALCAAGQVAAARPLLDDPDPGVRWSVAAALRASGAAGAAAGHLTRWGRSPEVAVRRGACRVLAGAAPLGQEDLALLAALRADGEFRVQEAAVEAAIAHPEAPVVDLMLRDGAGARLAPALARFLAGRGDASAPVITAGLRGEGPAATLQRWRLARACGGLSPPAAWSVLAPCLDDGEATVRRVARTTLLELGWRGTADDPRLRQVLAADRERAVGLLGALAALQPIDPEHLLIRALREAVAAHRLDVATAADLVAATPIASRVAVLVDSGSSSEVATAEETMEVTFAGERRRLLAALLRPGLGAAGRLALLGGMVPDPAAALGGLLDAGNGWADPWLRACAVWWWGRHPVADLEGAVEALSAMADPVLAETAAAIRPGR